MSLVEKYVVEYLRQKKNHLSFEHAVLNSFAAIQDEFEEILKAPEKSR